MASCIYHLANEKRDIALSSCGRGLQNKLRNLGGVLRSYQCDRCHLPHALKHTRTSQRTFFGYYTPCIWCRDRMTNRRIQSSALDGAHQQHPSRLYTCVRSFTHSILYTSVDGECARCFRCKTARSCAHHGFVFFRAAQCDVRAFVLWSNNKSGTQRIRVC